MPLNRVQRYRLAPVFLFIIIYASLVCSDLRLKLISVQTDSTRAKDLELHIQSRVTSELSRLSASHSAALAELAERISTSEDSEVPSGETSSAKSVITGDQTGDLGRESVQKEIEGLKSKLRSRRIREDIIKDNDVERAKEKLVGCLRLNDRRPLDCWEEVDTFKKEVGRLEKAFLGRVME